MYDDPYRNYLNPRDLYSFGYDAVYPTDAAYYGAVQRLYPEYDMYGAAYRAAQPYLGYSDYAAYPSLYDQAYFGQTLNRGAEQLLMRDPYDAIGAASAAARLRGANPFSAPNPYDLGAAQDSRYSHAASGHTGNYFADGRSFADYGSSDQYGLHNSYDNYAAQSLFGNRQSDPYNLPDSQYDTRNYGVGEAPRMVDPFDPHRQDYDANQSVNQSAYDGSVNFAAQTPAGTADSMSYGADFGTSGAMSPDAYSTMQSSQYQNNTAYRDSLTDQLEGYDIAEPPYFGMDYGSDVPQGQSNDPSLSNPMQGVLDPQLMQQNQVSMSGFEQQPIQQQTFQDPNNPNMEMSSMSGMQPNMQFASQFDAQGMQGGQSNIQGGMLQDQQWMQQNQMQQNQFDPNAGFGDPALSAGAPHMPGMQDAQGNPMMQDAQQGMQPGMQPDQHMPGMQDMQPGMQGMPPFDQQMPPGAPPMDMQFGPDGQPMWTPGLTGQADGSALKCLIFGILSILFSLIPPVGVVLGLLTRSSVKKFRTQGGVDGKAGLANILGLVGIILSAIILVLIVVFVILLLTGSQFALGIANAYNQSPIGSLIKIPI